ncbi:ParB N-terminal domain-containing protein [Aeromonas dhakensis]|uniref:ParB/RepB/Spo0J family partition protein n=1 Tax=Aeromonas TaxID=642 RepID=UPI0022E87730|nr:MULTISPECIES: ParB N-terminal domain-containing protein [Aeromonas]MDD9227933.1 ParB N-terminal domain-containing protein [Aeromonas hydrophila]MDM5056536.1 ParB N-terminal domain-containing protein [Aeromonas dhakensis]MDM5082693.1 ParB N-terminal domain-containing protein [Aeromonas dhakensis]
MSKEKLKFTFEDPRHLVKNKWNPNKMSPEEEAKLRNSLQKHGHVRPILVRTLEDGTLEIVGGEHRVEVSIDLGMTEVPVINLGQISDEDAKRALMIDNSRYGHDDAGLLSELLTGLGSADELAEWMNMGVDELGALLGASESPEEADLLGALDDLDAMDEEPLAAPVREIQTHQAMKYKVPVEDSEFVKDTIERIIKEQGITDSDSAIRAGEALLWLCRNYEESFGGKEPARTEMLTDAELDLLADFGMEDLNG